jgi:hypothetical protein
VDKLIVVFFVLGSIFKFKTLLNKGVIDYYYDIKICTARQYLFSIVLGSKHVGVIIIVK